MYYSVEYFRELIKFKGYVYLNVHDCMALWKIFVCPKAINYAKFGPD